MSWSERTRVACGDAARERLPAGRIWYWAPADGPNGEVRVFLGRGPCLARCKAERWCRARPDWIPVWT